jgi:hypothetical protein
MSTKDILNKIANLPVGPSDIPEGSSARTDRLLRALRARSSAMEAQHIGRFCVRLSFNNRAR